MRLAFTIAPSPRCAYHLAQSIRAVKASGTIALIGNVSGSVAEINLPYLFMKAARLGGVVTGNRDAFEAMARAIDATRLTPVVDDTNPDRLVGILNHNDVLAAFQRLG